MPDTIEGQLFGKPVTMRVGDKVGILWTGDEDTFAGTEGEIIEIIDNLAIGVRTHNGICIIRGRLEVVPAMPRKRGGRRPVKREPGEKVIAISVTLPESDIAYLRTFNPRNLSDAIRQVIAAHQS